METITSEMLGNMKHLKWQMQWYVKNDVEKTNTLGEWTKRYLEIVDVTSAKLANYIKMSIQRLEEHLDGEPFTTELIMVCSATFNCDYMLWYGISNKNKLRAVNIQLGTKYDEYTLDNLIMFNSVHGDQIHGDQIHDLAKLTNLTTDQLFTVKNLALTDMGLDEVPNGVYSLTQLETLTLSFNNISKLSPKIANLVNLTTLNLSYNMLEDANAQLDVLKKMPKLTHIIFVCNFITCKLPAQFIMEKRQIELPTSKPSFAKYTHKNEIEELQLKYGWDKNNIIDIPTHITVHFPNKDMSRLPLNRLHTLGIDFLKLQLKQEHLAPKHLPKETAYIKEYIKLYISKIKNKHTFK